MTPPGRISEKSVTTSDLVSDFSAAAFDSAIQKPINGLSQLTGKVVGHELPKLSLVEVPKAETGAENFAQQAGAAVGMLVPFLGTRALVRGALGSRLGTGYGGVALEGGVTGLGMGTVLTPVENGQPFWQTRLANGLTDAGTFSLLNVTGKGVGSLKAFGMTAETPLVSRIGKGALAGSISSLPAGFAHAELHSITHGKGPASASEVFGDMTGFALFGGVLGGVGGARARSRFLQNSEAADAAKPPVQAETVRGSEPAKAEPVKGETARNAERAGGNQDGPSVITEGTRVYTTEEMLKVVEAREAAARQAREAAAKVETADPNKIIKVKKEGYIDAGDEGKVYSNGDGSVTKIYHDSGRSMEAVKAIYDKLNSIGIKTPKILEIGKSEEGLPAMRMEQIGDGDPLRWQLMMREITGADLASLRQQYWAYADALNKANLRIDWNLKNMRFENGQLYILDPSFMKNEQTGQGTFDMFATMIGPRP
jgi:hypothetical protein